jgi:hypothetical protein
MTTVKTAMETVRTALRLSRDLRSIPEPTSRLDTLTKSNVALKRRLDTLIPKKGQWTVIAGHTAPVMIGGVLRNMRAGDHITVDEVNLVISSTDSNIPEVNHKLDKMAREFAKRDCSFGDMCTTNDREVCVGCQARDALGLPPSIFGVGNEDTHHG